MKRQRMIKIANCLKCDKEFHYNTNNKSGKYCSQNCAGKIKHNIKRNCLTCNKEMTLAQWEVKADRQFCSQVCSTISQTGIKKTILPIYTCKECNKEFQQKRNYVTRPKFCSRKCASEAISFYLTTNPFPKANKFYEKATPEEFLNRLKQKYEKQVIRNEAGCWEWKGATQRGYGTITHSKGKTERAHRFSWLIHHGEFDKSLHVLHKCDNRLCTRPDHLFLGTAKDNSNDKVFKKRQHSKLQPEQVIEIRKLIAKKTPYLEIASKFNVNTRTISAINKRHIWKHVS